MTEAAFSDSNEGVQGRSGVLVVGSITADLTTFSDRLPARGETILGNDFTLVLGGKGANQAIAAALAGTETHMCACVGSDLFSDLLTDGLRDAGVRIDHVLRVPGPSGIAHIRVDGSGENDIVMVPLANAAVTTEQIDDAFRAYGAHVRVLLTQLEIPLHLTLHAIRRAREADMTVVLDPAPAAALDPDIWPLVDIVTPNETEAGLLTGIPVTDTASAVAAGRWFTDRSAGAALITRGEYGVVLVTADDVAIFEPIPVRAVDTTAAGDAFAGYLGASLAAGRDLHDAVERAATAGALAATRRGASPSIPRGHEVDELFATRRTNQ